MSLQVLWNNYHLVSRAFEQTYFAPEEELAWWRLKCFGALAMLKSAASSMAATRFQENDPFATLSFNEIESACGQLIEALSEKSDLRIESLSDDICAMLDLNN